MGEVFNKIEVRALLEEVARLGLTLEDLVERASRTGDDRAVSAAWNLVKERQGSTGDEPRTGQ